MAKKHIFLILFFFLLLLICIRIPWLLSAFNEDEAKAQEGIMNLQGWDFDADGILMLNGDWTFYPGQMLEPGEVGTSESETISVPGKWHAYFDENYAEMEKFGTYRLLIQLPEEHVKRLYQILLPRNLISSRVFANGQLVIDNKMDGSSSANLVRQASFRTNDENEIEILIHFEGNSVAKREGIKKTIRFGDDTSLNTYQNQNVMAQLLIAAISLLSSAYTFLFFIVRKGEVKFLYFSLGTLCLGIATLMDDDKLLLNLIPMEYIASLKILFLAYISIVAFLLLFIKSFLGEYKENRMVKILHGLQVFSALAILLSPLRFFSDIALFVFVILTSTLGVMAYLIWKLVRLGSKEFIFLMLGAVSAASSFVWGIFKSRNPAELPYFPGDILVAFVALSIFLFLLFTRIRNENKEMALKLQEELKRKDHFLANTAHELKNPLHSLMNIAYSILQKEEGKLSANAENDLGLLVSISRHMSVTLEDLLDAARLDEHAIHLDKRRVNLNKLVSGIVDVLKLTIEHKKIDIDLQIVPDFPEVSADENRLIQILFNLLHNAVKFTEEGTITIRAVKKGSLAVIEVADTGVGMDEETVQNIFQRYTQAETSSGLGLGLNIARQLTELHGGELTVSTVPGEGSVFAFTLELAEEALDPPTTELLKPESGGEVFSARMDPVYEKIAGLHEPAALSYRPRILIVDDDPINLKVLSNILAEDQYDVESVHNADQAIERISGSEWDVVITDVMMPQVSGYGLTRMIREKFSFLELPVLHLTARGQPEDIYAGFLSGANDYVAKPVDSLELRVRVNALADLKRSINERLRVEGAWLQAQIKPHFLFNTLNTIASLSEIDPERMAGLLEQFGNYLRRSFNPGNLERVVPLAQELELVQSYLYIEQERFSSRLQVEWNVNTEGNIHVPPLSIQTVVENAVQHGVLKNPEGGIVQIIVRGTEKEAVISIVDDGVGIPFEKQKDILTASSVNEKGIGLINTDLRLKQLYGAGLVIESIPGNGTHVSFTVKPVFTSDRTEMERVR